MSFDTSPNAGANVTADTRRPLFTFDSQHASEEGRCDDKTYIAATRFIQAR